MGPITNYRFHFSSTHIQNYIVHFKICVGKLSLNEKLIDLVYSNILFTKYKIYKKILELKWLSKLISSSIIKLQNHRYFSPHSLLGIFRTMLLSRNNLLGMINICLWGCDICLTVLFDSTTSSLCNSIFPTLEVIWIELWFRGSMRKIQLLVRSSWRQEDGLLPLNHRFIGGLQGAVIKEETL